MKPKMKIRDTLVAPLMFGAMWLLYLSAILGSEWTKGEITRFLGK